MTDVVAYRRFIGPTLAIDSRWEPITPEACHLLSKVWVGNLNRGDYVRIELMLTDGSVVIVRKLKPKPIPLDVYVQQIGRGQRPVYDPFERS